MTKIIFFDPSGNHGKREGDGTTGFSVWVDGELKEFGNVKAKDYMTQERYWHEVWNVIDHNHPDLVVWESYRLFAHKAQQQSGSSLDTPQMLGYLKMMCWYRQLKWLEQAPADKVRVNDEQLVKLGFFELKNKRYYCNGVPAIIHERDSLRHGYFFFKYGKGKEMLKDAK